MAATKAQIKAFIEEIAPCAMKAYKEFGKVLPSVCIGMACVESGYGTSKIMRNHNAFLGQKCGTGKTATKNWDKTFFVTKTKEEYVIGVHTVITDAFRSYKDMQQCVNNYYELLNTKLYSRVEGGVDYVKQMEQIKLCGYMTSSTEVKSVIKIIQDNNLTQYDKGTKPVVIKADAFTVGKTYTLQTDLYVRKDPNGANLTLKDLTINARMHAFTDGKGNAILKKGTRVTCKEIKANKAIWIRIPSGWVCAKSSTGTLYIA